MGFFFELEDYPRYLERVGEATYLDVTRRTDPARVGKVWDNLRTVVESYGAPWIVQLWTKDATGALGRGEAVLTRTREAGTTLAAQVTVTGLGGTTWEPLAPSTPFYGVEDLSTLAGGPDHIKWRYDPVIPTAHRLDTFRSQYHIDCGPVASSPPSCRSMAKAGANRSRTSSSAIPRAARSGQGRKAYSM